MTDLERARADVEVLRRLGIKDNVTHYHVGANSTRCEFCLEPLWIETHDPMNVKAGKIINKAVTR
jgi:hypothetical protein